MNNTEGKKEKALKFLAGVLKLSGGFPFSPFYSGLGTILMLHRVRPSEDKQRIWSNAHLEITPEHLEQAILFFKKRNYQIVCPEEIYEILSGKKKTKKRIVAFTFDDGYKDNLEYAYPVFRKYNIPFSIYIISDFPDYKSILWWDVLEEKILAKDNISLDWYGSRLDFSCKTYGEKLETYDRIHELVQTDGHENLNARALMLCKQLGRDPYEMIRKSALSWEEIKQLSEDPLVTIGAHTVSHPVLKNLPDEKCMREIFDCKSLIEEKTGIKVEHFAYPFGGHEHAFSREYEFAEEAGYKTAVTTISANIFRGHRRKLMCLPRIEYGSSMNNNTLELIKYGMISCIRNKGRRIN